MSVAQDCKLEIAMESVGENPPKVFLRQNQDLKFI